MKKSFLATALAAALCLAFSAHMPAARADSLDSPRVIDGMRADEKKDEFVMVLNVPDNWKDHAKTFGRIDRKLAGYVDFIKNGPIKNLNSQNKPIRIDISLAHKPDAEANKFFKLKSQQLKKLKLAMHVDVPSYAKPPYDDE